MRLHSEIASMFVVVVVLVGREEMVSKSFCLRIQEKSTILSYLLEWPSNACSNWFEHTTGRSLDGYIDQFV